MLNNTTSAADLAANFQVAELEPRLENMWGEVPVEPSLPQDTWPQNGGNGN